MNQIQPTKQVLLTRAEKCVFKDALDFYYEDENNTVGMNSTVAELKTKAENHSTVEVTAEQAQIIREDILQDFAEEIQETLRGKEGVESIFKFYEENFKTLSKKLRQSNTY